jgi:protein TonB
MESNAMYAEHRYVPRQSRTVSLGAAFLINGALIAGLIYSAPNVISKVRDREITLIDILDPPEPPPIDLPKPKLAPRDAQMPTPTAPEPTIKTSTPNETATTTDIGPPVPPLPPVPNVGPTYVPETMPAPMPPLMVAEQDLRYLKDFQPAYPNVELRAERDGLVKIRVLIGIDGRVKQTESVSATSDAFFDATRRQALSKWRFKPASRGGIPQESWKTISVRFEIKNQ